MIARPTTVAPNDASELAYAPDSVGENVAVRFAAPRSTGTHAHVAVVVESAGPLLVAKKKVGHYEHFIVSVYISDTT